MNLEDRSSMGEDLKMSEGDSGDADLARFWDIEEMSVDDWNEFGDFMKTSISRFGASRYG